MCVLSLWSFSLQSAQAKAREEEKESSEMSENTSKAQKTKPEEQEMLCKDEDFKPITGSVWFYIIEYKVFE